MRTLALPALLLIPALTACDGSQDTEDTDPDTDSPVQCADNPDASVPEEYRCLWESTYSGCTTSRGGEGRQIYYLMEGEVDAEGNITGSERIWWFYPDQWAATDCVDTISMSGGPITTDLERLGCGECEEAYEVRREVTVESCQLGYNILFEEDDDGLHQTLLMDTKTPDGQPQEDGNILVFQRTSTDGGGMKTEEYARGTMVPTGQEHGPPYTFSWLGSACLSR